MFKEIFGILKMKPLVNGGKIILQSFHYGWLGKMIYYLLNFN